MPRGGSRAGKPGAYANRTDLNAQKSLPVRAATNQSYGKAGQQLAAQRTVPMAPPPTPVASPPLQTSPVPLTSGTGAGGAAPGTSPPPGVAPGSLGILNRPTERPGEPVTTGINMGAGQGQEALPQSLTGTNSGPLSTLLNQLARTSGSASLSQLAQQAQSLGQ